MAHKGKIYPVLFRRDWNLNVDNYDAGFANRYLFVEHDRTTGFGTFIRGQTFDCGPATKTAFSIMSWKSQVVHIGLFDFRIELHAEIVAAGNGYDLTIDIIEQHVGVIATIRRGAVGSKQGGFAQGPFDRTIYFDPHWYDSYPFLELSTSLEKRWTDGPPH